MYYRSQVEVHTAIICASLPSLQPVFKQVFHKTSFLQRTREPYYYYGGGQNSMAASTIMETVQVERRGLDSIDLERPAPTYAPQSPMREHQMPKILIVQHLTNDEVVRERVRAFSSHTTSVYSQPTSPTHPSHILMPH
jgi:hypothetical protein